MLSLFIGKRFSRSKKRNQLVSFISLSSFIGIAVGVAVIIIGLSAMNGFEQELEKRVLSVIPQAQVEGVKAPIENWTQIMETSKLEPDILAAAPYVKSVGLVEKSDQLKAIQIQGVDTNLEPTISNMTQYITPNVWSNFKPNQKQIILGQGVADKLNVKLGDAVTLLISPRGTQQELKAPQRIRLKVVGFLNLGGQIDHNVALLPLADSQAYLKLGNKVDGLSFKVKDVFQAERTISNLGEKIPTYVYLRTWKEQYGFLYHDINMVRAIMYLVMILVIGVASFNIVSTLMMAVKDRQADIAILRTMGAQDKLVRHIFIWYGAMSGGLGAVVGSLIGVLISLNLTSIIKSIEKLIHHQFLSGDIYFIDFLPSKVSLHDVLLVSLTAIILSLAATWYPARKATQLNPAQVLSSK